LFKDFFFWEIKVLIEGGWSGCATMSHFVQRFFFLRNESLIPCNYIVVYLVMPKHI
jgi:hypothetical protein